MKERSFVPTAAIFETTKELEKFQNSMLRPIIKSLNGLLFEYFQNYLILQKFDMTDRTYLKKMNLLPLFY
ncbi:hypothetical protein MKD41_06210 [Lutibacter sp. A64]|uniref:hypothetical protein n=1 Tax=Lutibacter sp. A64 TaxID=2918526 RepID=UPI001F06D5AD|nr:hypothetical protein [Lutibacter sp. A64]UMB55065.1 hypothetical protein MKD41_06210 [Lutibacter sp. A64]